MGTDRDPSPAALYGRLAAVLAGSARLAIALAGACALAALAGWAFSVDLLARFVPGWPHARPATATGALALAIGFALRLTPDPRRRALGLVLLVVLGIAVVAAIMAPAAPLDTYPGSALLLLATAAAFATHGGSRELAAARLLAASCAALLFIAVIGISFRLLLELPPLVDISLPSLIALLLLTYAAVAAKPDVWLIERLTSHQAGAVITRRLLPAVLVLPLVIAWLELAGEASGRLDSAFGAVLQTVLTIFGLAALVLWGARKLDRLEMRRQAAEQALRRAYAELDQRVAERTAELERLMANEQRLRTDAERANRAKDEFLAIVSHELRSPLNALRGWGFLLGSAATPDASLIERATQAIKRNVDHQARLIDDLLDTSRIMSGKLNIERRPVNLVEVLQAAIEVVKQSAVAKRIEIAFETAKPSIMLEGDAARLNQIAVNLLSNAVKFTPEGGVVKVSMRAEAGVARFSVADNGTGIAEEFLPRVFERFTQADTSTTRRHGGLGIGLALVRHLAELHGGTVRAESEGLGKGATFTVELPAMTAPEHAAQEAPPPQGVPRGGLAGASVCAVDDDPDARDIISLTLRQAGADVRTVASGAELIAVLDHELPRTRPDVLLMDLAMPDEDGFTVLARVRALEGSKSMPPGQAIPAIAVTAFTEVTRERVIEQGFVDHVSKPIDPARLVATVRRAIDV